MAGKRTRSKRPGLALLSALDRICGFPRPRQQFAETVDRVSVDHPREHVTQISVGLDVIKLAGFDQRTEHSPSMTAAITAREEMILSSESNRLNRALDGVRVQFGAAVVQEAGQTMPARQRVPDRFGECAASRQNGSCASSQARKASMIGLERRRRAASRCAGD